MAWNLSALYRLGLVGLCYGAWAHNFAQAQADTSQPEPAAATVISQKEQDTLVNQIQLESGLSFKLIARSATPSMQKVPFVGPVMPPQDRLGTGKINEHNTPETTVARLTRKQPTPPKTCLLQWVTTVNTAVDRQEQGIPHEQRLPGAAPCYFFAETQTETQPQLEPKPAEKTIKRVARASAIPDKRINAIYLIGLTPAELSEKQRSYHKASGYCTRWVQALVLKETQWYLSKPQEIIACADDTLDEKLYFNLANGDLQSIGGLTKNRTPASSANHDEP